MELVLTEETLTKRKKYHRTKKGFLVLLYSNMRSRVKGQQRANIDIYFGLDILTREQFYEWANASPEFHRLFDKWVENKYVRRQAPSVDRIDGNKGYTLDNIQWLTFSDNCAKAGREIKVCKYIQELNREEEYQEI